MKSLVNYIKESIFKDPIEMIKSIDLTDIFKKFKSKSTFSDGFEELKNFVAEQQPGKQDNSELGIIKPDDYDNIDNDKNYIAFIDNVQTGEVTAPHWAIHIYMANVDKTIVIGGDWASIDGSSEIDNYTKRIVNKCDPKEELTSMKEFGMTKETVYEISPELINVFYKELSSLDIVKECGDAGGATPGNTMGAGDPALPGENGELGSGDSFQRMPSPKKEKLSKKHKKIKQQEYN